MNADKLTESVITTLKEHPTIRLTEHGKFLVSGDLTFASVARLLDEGDRLLAGITRPVIDLSEVTHCDSAGLALLLEWLDRGRAKGAQIRFCHLPESLLRIARLSNLDSMLPVAEE